MKFLAYLTKGVKEVAKDELAETLPHVEIEKTSDKYIIFNTSKANLTYILDLKTIDDAHMLLDFQKHDKTPKPEIVAKEFPLKKLEKARKLVKDFRTTENTFSITTSKYRNEEVELEQIENTLSRKIEEATNLEFNDSQHSNLDIRIHLEEENIIASIRLTSKPLYFRNYWQKGRKGSLKTSVAATLCKIANPSKGEQLVDNFCGSGTILCEAKLQGLEVSGGDINREAIKCARKNMREINAEAANQIRKLDATSTSHPNSCFDIAVSNLPWGKQVELDAVKLYSKTIREYSRILKEDARVVILGTHPDLAEKHLRKHFPDHEIDRIQFGFLGHTPTVTYAYPV